MSSPSKPNTLQASIPRQATVRVTIKDVTWMCKVTHSLQRSTIIIAWTAVDSTLEFLSLENYVRSLAQSRPWLAEELVAVLADELTRLLGTQATVYMVFDEHDKMTVEVEA